MSGGCALSFSFFYLSHTLIASPHSARLYKTSKGLKERDTKTDTAEDTEMVKQRQTDKMAR